MTKRSTTQIVLVVLIACLLFVASIFAFMIVRENRRDIFVSTAFQATSVELLNNTGYMVTINGNIKNKRSYNLMQASIKVVVKVSGSSFSKTYHYDNITILAGEQYTINQTVLTTAGYNQVIEVLYKTHNGQNYTPLKNPYSLLPTNAMIAVMIALMASIVVFALLEISRMRKQNQLAYEKAKRNEYEAQQLAQNMSKVQSEKLSFDDRIKNKKKQPICEYCGILGEAENKKCPYCGAKYK